MTTQPKGQRVFGDAITWDAAWASIRFRALDGDVVSYLRWFAAVGVGRLVIVLAEDDPLLERVDPHDEVGVAAVRGRGTVERSRRDFPAKLELLNGSEVGRIGQQLNHKYAGRRWIFRPAFWLVRTLDGSRHRRTDVPVRLELIPTGSWGDGQAVVTTRA